MCLPIVKDLDKNRTKGINSIKASIPHWPELDLTTSGTHSPSSEWFSSTEETTGQKRFI